MKRIETKYGFAYESNFPNLDEVKNAIDKHFEHKKERLKEEYHETIGGL